jgi:hypothetical protein
MHLKGKDRNFTQEEGSSRRDTGRARLGAIVLALGSLLAWNARASAHEGPPYPIFVDKQAGPYLVSVWADPDVGVGTFFIVAEPSRGGMLPNEIKVEVCVRPVAGRLAEACYKAERDGVRDRVQYKIGVPFDRQEFWRVRVILQSPLGDGEAAADVEATPPGLGRWDVLLYVFPFVTVGVLWLRAVFKGRSRRHVGSVARTVSQK